MENNLTSSVTQVSTQSSQNVLLRLNLRQHEVNPESATPILNENTLEFASRLGELNVLDPDIYANVIRPSRIATFSPLASTAAVMPDPVLVREIDHNLAIPISDASPSFLVQDNFLGGSEIRPRIIPLPSDILTEEQAPIFVNSFLGCLLPIPEEAIIALSPVLAEETTRIVNIFKQTVLAEFNQASSNEAMYKFEQFRALQDKIYEDSQKFKLGTTPIPQIKYYTLWKFVIFKIFSLFSNENIEILITFLTSSTITLGSCACLILLYIMRPLFLTYMDVRFWRNSFFSVRTIFLRVLFDLQHIRLSPAISTRLSQFDIRVRYQRGFDLFATRSNISLNIAREQNSIAYEHTLEAIRMYRLERRGILIQDGILNSNSSLVIANAASESLTASHDEIRREVEAKLSWGFLRYFRRGGGYWYTFWEYSINT